jgi:hypothetical protein
MSDTIGSLIDKLTTVDLKMWHNQELLYAIRRMTFEQFKEAYLSDEEKARNLFNYMSKAADLNVQRQNLITEIDLGLVNFVKSAIAREDLDDGKHVQRQHKTY